MCIWSQLFYWCKLWLMIHSMYISNFVNPFYCADFGRKSLPCPVITICGSKLFKMWPFSVNNWPLVHFFKQIAVPSIFWRSWEDAVNLLWGDLKKPWTRHIYLRVADCGLSGSIKILCSDSITRQWLERLYLFRRPPPSPPLNFYPSVEIWLLSKIQYHLTQIKLMCKTGNGNRRST